jgi:hypothetical protein
MLQSGRWRDYRHDRGRVIQFVVDWLLRYARWQVNGTARGRHNARWRRLSPIGVPGDGEGDGVVSTEVPARDEPPPLDSQAVARARRLALTLTPEDAPALEVYARTGSAAMAAAVLGQTAPEVRASLRRVREVVGPYLSRP